MNPITSIADRLIGALSTTDRAKANVRAHETALAAFYAKFHSIAKARTDVAVAIAAAQERIAKAEAVEARLAATNDALIVARAAAETGEGSPEQVAALDRQRTALRAEVEALADDKRVASLVLAKHMERHIALAKDQEAHNATWPRLAHPVLYSQFDAAVAEYHRSLEAHRAVGLRVFGLATALDEVAKNANLGIFVGSGRAQDFYAALRVAPVHPSFTRTALEHQEAERAFYEDIRSIADTAIKDLGA